MSSCAPAALGGVFLRGGRFRKSRHFLAKRTDLWFNLRLGDPGYRRGAHGPYSIGHTMLSIYHLMSVDNLEPDDAGL